jgi:predicted PilT family ATPase
LPVGRGHHGYSLVSHPNRVALARSGIVFGLPGMGKTTYVKRIARYLGWPLVTFDR